MGFCDRTVAVTTIIQVIALLAMLFFILYDFKLRERQANEFHYEVPNTFFAFTAAQYAVVVFRRLQLSEDAGLSRQSMREIGFVVLCGLLLVADIFFFGVFVSALLSGIFSSSNQSSGKSSTKDKDKVSPESAVMGMVSAVCSLIFTLKIIANIMLNNEDFMDFDDSSTGTMAATRNRDVHDSEDPLEA